MLAHDRRGADVVALNGRGADVLAHDRRGDTHHTDVVALDAQEESPAFEVLDEWAAGPR